MRVLSHEWAPPSAFSDEALRAGALAVKDYAWYWATRPTKLSDVAAWGVDAEHAATVVKALARHGETQASRWGSDS